MGEELFESLFRLDNYVVVGASAALSRTLMAPLERTKILLQVQKVTVPQIKEYTGMINCLGRIRKEQGFHSYWRGNSANLCRYIPIQMANYIFRDRFKNIFVPEEGDPQSVRHICGNFMAAGTAVAISSILVYPLDVVRTHLAVDIKPKCCTIFGCLKQLSRAEGAKSVYRGLTIFVVPRTVCLGIVDNIRDNSCYNMICPAGFNQAKFLLAYSVVNLALLPIDTVSRRMMLQIGKKPEDKKYKVAVDCYKTIAKEEGMKSFFRGALPNMLRGLGGIVVMTLCGELMNCI